MIRKLVVSAIMCCLPALGSAGPDLSDTIPILDEQFEIGLNLYDGKTGVWSTLPRRGKLMTNAAETVFLDKTVLGAAAESILPPLHEITGQGLALRTIAVPDAAKPALRAYMQSTGQGASAADVLYGTAQINTSQTWAQTYGYFEIEARIPRGQGRWPAFWLTFAGEGWPPEIDVLEAYGAGFDAPTKWDNQFNTAVFFDARDAEKNKTQDVNIENPFDADPNRRVPKVKTRGQNQIYNFAKRQNPQRDFGINIYDDFSVYAMMWTPETITFYFGKDRDTLAEVYRTPTPEDVNDPMYVIINDQFTARGGWWPARPEELTRVLDPQNAFFVRRVEFRALSPSVVLNMVSKDEPNDPRSSSISDTSDDDAISPGGGFDIIRLSGGRDQIMLTRGRENKIIEGFGADDQVSLTGYPFTNAADTLARLTQVGEDVWLPAGAKAFWPQTVIFRSKAVADFTEANFIVR